MTIEAKQPASSPTLERLLTSSETAAVLSIPEAILSEWRLTGKGPAHIALGREVRYDPADIRAFIEVNRQSAPGRQREQSFRATIGHRIWGPTQVAQYLDLSTRTVTYFAFRGDLPGFKIGSKWRFYQHEIENLPPHLEKIVQERVAGLPAQKRVSPVPSADPMPARKPRKKC